MPVLPLVLFDAIWLLLLPPLDDFLLFDFDEEFDFFTLFCDLCFDVLLDVDDCPDDDFVGVVGFISKESSLFVLIYFSASVNLVCL